MKCITSNLIDYHCDYILFSPRIISYVERDGSLTLLPGVYCRSCPLTSTQFTKGFRIAIYFTKSWVFGTSWV